MRTKPILGKKLWFAAKGSLGWGWTPVSWEGWAVTGLAVVGTVVLAAALEDAATAPIFLLVGALILVCWLKGTSPGGRTARRMFEIQRERESDPGDPGTHRIRR